MTAEPLHSSMSYRTDSAQRSWRRIPSVERRVRGYRGLAATLLGAAFALGTAVDAHAQTRTDDRVAAESLFSDARRLMQAGAYEQACQKFEASRRLEPALGATLNLADCYEKLGRTASAWAEFKSAAAEAQRVGDSARKVTALQRAAALEPRLSRLWLQTDDTTISVLRNGEPVDAGILGNAIPVDPGPQQLEARAPGKVAWTNRVEVSGEGAVVEVRIPPLADEPTLNAAGALQPAESISPPPPEMADHGSSTQRTLAWVSGGVGVAGIGAGVVFTLLASSNWSKAEKSCVDYPYGCTPDGVSRGDDANTQATVATVAFAVGGVALGTSLVLFLTDSGGSASAEIALTPTEVRLRGTF